MIVKVRKIHRKLKDNEIRVINIDRQAIGEILWEHLMEQKAQYFHTHSISGEEIYLMDWDEEAGLLTYAAVPLRHLLEGKEIDWQALRNKVGLTTASVFSAKRFRRVKIDGSVLVDRRRQEG